MRTTRCRLWACAIAVACAWVSPVTAADLAGRKQISLLAEQGEKVVIGHAEFAPKGGRYSFRVVLSDQPFGDYFLAMRPFKCIAHSVQQVCHFPYRTSGQISEDDLVDLEYALMFLHKKPQAVSVDPWNGVYYRMQVVDSRIEGSAHNVDMNLVIEAPFDTPERLIAAKDLHPADAGSHRFPRLVIE